MLLDDLLTVLKTSAGNAYTVGSQTYSYPELYRYVCNLYQFLTIENKARRPVVVYGHKEVYMKAAFLACSFAGITYVPIDAGMPQERIRMMLHQVNPALIMGDFSDPRYQTLPASQMTDIMEKTPAAEITQILLKPDDLYYILFTSGSTGVPKGVKVTYRNVDSCINWLKRITKAEKGVILNQANFSFDLSVADLYLSVATGSEHFILEDTAKNNFPQLFSALKRSGTTLAVMTPSFADLLLLDRSFGSAFMPSLKTILFCGEKLLKSTVEKLHARFPNLDIINSYGPTECTFAVTSVSIPVLMEKNDLPVGRPKSDVEIFIVDEEKSPLKEGEIGEILITGESVADGYLVNPDDPSFFMFHGEKAYLTGDLGYLDDAVLYFKCRKDKQVKYQGYRIELSDIERNLCALGYIEKAVVLPKLDGNQKITRLFAFVKLQAQERKTTVEIRQDLLLKIPPYMCPVIRIVDEFPINQNGKCDEQKLRMEYVG